MQSTSGMRKASCMTFVYSITPNHTLYLSLYHCHNNIIQYFQSNSFSSILQHDVSSTCKYVCKARNI